jgi:SulP family sulfate permease
MASLAALLVLIAWNMLELRHVQHMVRVAPRSDLLVLLTCYGLTVVVDMVMAVGVGVVLASFLFMNRMAEITHSRVLQDDGNGETDRVLPPGVALYEIAGALFFGAAKNAMTALDAIGANVKVVVIGLGRVGVIDATGWSRSRARWPSSSATGSSSSSLDHCPSRGTSSRRPSSRSGWTTWSSPTTSIRRSQSRPTS